ncbi:histidine phosphatase family protein [Streptosporangium amethystogenes subsp. fukuiense]|uniref:phosphoglycerate mutase (2,3-diphosphoglycerate-dependent) n=1 Tax=Streptosporangium amethystogenes subsp. fukuiense TaxID=698418 RepID=A0ABW2SUZ8_9ACTN
MILAVVRHAESIENADKYNGFYRDRRPYGGQVAHDLSRTVVGLTPRGFRQAVWLGGVLAETVGAGARVYTSTYRRAIDTAQLAFPDLSGGWPRRTALLDEQHYGEATYMTKQELFATYPDGAEDRRLRKHLWIPPGGGESLAGGVWQRALGFLALLRTDTAPDSGSGARAVVVAITHHTMILALRALLEARPVEEVVTESRETKIPNAAIIRYEMRGDAIIKPIIIAPSI